MSKNNWRNKQVWNSVIQGLSTEIVRWESSYLLPGEEQVYPKVNWNYYVYIPEYIVNDFDSLWLPVDSDYYSLSIAQADWHGGITYYEKFNSDSKQHRYIKVGCDYNHIFDEGQTYIFEDIERDVIATVKSLHTILSFKEKPASSS
jgi:hypothetical protein